MSVAVCLYIYVSVCLYISVLMRLCVFVRVYFCVRVFVRLCVCMFVSCEPVCQCVRSSRCHTTPTICMVMYLSIY